MRPRIAVEIMRKTHRALAKYAKASGVSISDAADALLNTGIGRAEAVKRNNAKRKEKVETAPGHVEEGAAT